MCSTLIVYRLSDKGLQISHLSRRGQSIAGTQITASNLFLHALKHKINQVCSV